MIRYHGLQPDPLLLCDSVSCTAYQQYTVWSRQAELCRRHINLVIRSCSPPSANADPMSNIRSHQVFADETSNNDQLTSKQRAC